MVKNSRFQPRKFTARIHPVMISTLPSEGTFLTSLYFSLIYGPLVKNGMLFDTPCAIKLLMVYHKNYFTDGKEEGHTSKVREYFSGKLSEKQDSITWVLCSTFSITK